MPFMVVSWDEAEAVTRVFDGFDEAVRFARERILAGGSPVTLEDIDTDRVWNEQQIRSDRDRSSR